MRQRLLRVIIVLLAGAAAFCAPPRAAVADDRTWEQLKPEVERLHRERRHTQLVAIAEEAMRAAEQALGPNDPQVANLILTIGLAHRMLAAEAMARYGRTEALLQRALQLFEQAQGPEHPDVALALNSLGELYTAQARFHEAKPLFERELAILEKTKGPNDLSVAAALKNLAWIDKAQGRYVEAQARYQRARAIMEDSFLLDDPLYRLIMNNLASLQTLAAAQPASADGLSDDEHQLVDEETQHRLKLSALEEVVGPDHPRVADVMHDLAKIVALQGRSGEAEALYQRALAIDEQGTDDDAQKKVLATLNRLIDLYTAQHRAGDALPLYERLLALMERRAGPQSEELLPVLEGYAHCLEAAGKPRDAEAARLRAGRIRAKR